MAWLLRHQLLPSDRAIPRRPVAPRQGDCGNDTYRGVSPMSGACRTRRMRRGAACLAAAANVPEAEGGHSDRSLPHCHKLMLRGDSQSARLSEDGGARRCDDCWNVAEFPSDLSIWFQRWGLCGGELPARTRACGSCRRRRRGGGHGRHRARPGWRHQHRSRRPLGRSAPGRKMASARRTRASRTGSPRRPARWRSARWRAGRSRTTCRSRLTSRAMVTVSWFIGARCSWPGRQGNRRPGRGLEGQGLRRRRDCRVRGEELEMGLGSAGDGAVANRFAATGWWCRGPWRRPSAPTLPLSGCSMAC